MAGKDSPQKKEADQQLPDGPAPLNVIDPALDGDGFAVVGVGASAGGLEAFSQLLRSLPKDPGLAIVFIQHMAPHHESALATLLTAATNLPVSQPTENVRLEISRDWRSPPRDPRRG